MKPYNQKIEETMQKFYSTLNEKQKRLYAANEAMKLGYGGKTYIHKLLGCDYKTINKGIKEFNNEDYQHTKRIRKSGGGRKSKLTSITNINEEFLKVIENNIAGDPMNAEIKWTNFSMRKIAKLLNEQEIEISTKIVKQLLNKHNFVKRKPLKSKAIGSCENRNEQFENIAYIKKL